MVIGGNSNTYKLREYVFMKDNMWINDSVIINNVI